MKKRKLGICILSIFIFSITILLVLHTTSLADVGSFDRYDSGGSSWSSSSSSSHSYGSGSSYSSSDWDSDYGSSSSGSSDFLFGLLFGTTFGRFTVLIIIIFIIIRVIINKNRTKDNSYYTQDAMQEQPVNTTSVQDVSQTHIYADIIKKIDPNFSEEKMLSYAKDLYVKMQNAWTARNWEPIRPFETESLFEQHKQQLQGYIDTNRINVVDRISVNYATIYKFRQEGDRDILEIALKATKKDYIIDATTKEVLEGNKNQDRITVYKMTFERKTGVLTQEGTNVVKTTNCPNCGAPTQIASAGKCEYCGSVITTGANSWALSGLEPLRE